MKGVLLFGHGARNQEWAAPFVRIRELIKARHPDRPVESGFLELMRPSFAEGIERLVEQGANEIVIVPIFMAAGSHIRKDLPRMAAQAMEQHSGIAIAIAAPVGESDAVLSAMADYAASTEADFHRE